MTSQATVENMTVEQWLAIRSEAALQIDPETAEVYVEICKCGGPLRRLSRREECIGRVYFARPAGSDVWVEFGDLPDATVKALREKQEFRRAFPEPTVYRRAEELLIVGENDEQFVRVRIEQVATIAHIDEPVVRALDAMHGVAKLLRGRR